MAYRLVRVVEGAPAFERRLDAPLVGPPRGARDDARGLRRRGAERAAGSSRCSGRRDRQVAPRARGGRGARRRATVLPAAACRTARASPTGRSSRSSARRGRGASSRRRSRRVRRRRSSGRSGRRSSGSRASGRSPSSSRTSTGPSRRCSTCSSISRTGRGTRRSCSSVSRGRSCSTAARVGRAEVDHARAAVAAPSPSELIGSCSALHARRRAARRGSRRSPRGIRSSSSSCSPCSPTAATRDVPADDPGAARRAPRLASRRGARRARARVRGRARVRVGGARRSWLSGPAPAAGAPARGARPQGADPSARGDRGHLPLPPRADPRRRLRADPKELRAELHERFADWLDGRGERVRRDRRLPPRAGEPLPGRARAARRSGRRHSPRRPRSGSPPRVGARTTVASTGGGESARARLRSLDPDRSASREPVAAPRPCPQGDRTAGTGGGDARGGGRAGERRGRARGRRGRERRARRTALHRTAQTGVSRADVLHEIDEVVQIFERVGDDAGLAPPSRSAERTGSGVERRRRRCGTSSGPRATHATPAIGLRRRKAFDKYAPPCASARRRSRRRSREWRRSALAPRSTPGSRSRSGSCARASRQRVTARTTRGFDSEANALAEETVSTPCSIRLPAKSSGSQAIQRPRKASCAQVREIRGDRGTWFPLERRAVLLDEVLSAGARRGGAPPG